MTPQQVALVQESWAAMGPQINAVAARFYHLLFEADPNVRDLFSEDPNVQADILVTEMALIVNSIPRFDAFTARARELGARHVQYGVTHRHFEIAERVLLQTFEETFGPAFTDELREAWRMGFDLMAETMMQGAADAVLEGARSGRRVDQPGCPEQLSISCSGRRAPRARESDR